MLVAVANRMQAALLAPTEVLAEQHFLTLSTLLRGSRVEVGLFTQRTRRQSRGKLFKQLAGGAVHVAVGTQALLQEDVEFANLGLVVVDEQHKLGVRQRATLKTKGHAPHSLVMTATPIPRTLALSFFADFDLSVIDELPPGRTPIKTSFFRTEQSAPAFEFVRRQVAEGRQAYVVLPQIDESPVDDVKSVKAEFERLGQGPLAGLRLAMLHGDMGTDEKRAAMDGFRAGSADVLVATTVIEVGVDVPNATVILIESAERFGLAQLHQLRGRVGRGGHESYCILVSDARGDGALQRLQAMCRTTDGFEIAELDLQLRGPGEFFGTRQSGLPELKVADVSRELELLKLCRDDAAAMLAADPHLSAPQHRAVHRALRQRFGDALPLAAIG
jgi:ATP-dependent DNA helicase RecG